MNGSKPPKCYGEVEVTEDKYEEGHEPTAMEPQYGISTSFELFVCPVCGNAIRPGV